MEVLGFRLKVKGFRLEVTSSNSKDLKPLTFNLKPHNLKPPTSNVNTSAKWQKSIKKLALSKWNCYLCNVFFMVLDY